MRCRDWHSKCSRTNPSNVTLVVIELGGGGGGEEIEILVRVKIPSRVEKSDEKLTTVEWSQLNHQIAHKQEGP